MNLDRRPSRDDYGQPLNTYWKIGRSWSDCGHINCDFFCIYIVFSGVGVGSGVRITGGVRGIANCRILAMDSNTLVAVSP